MEPSPTLFNALLEPAAVFSPPLPPAEELYNSSINKYESSSDSRGLDDDKDCSKSPTWRLDGMELDGTRFFITSLFMLGQGPLRIDVYIPDRCDKSQYMEGTLPGGFAALQAEQVAKHIMKALEHWSTHYMNFENVYRDMPFGSQRLLETVCNDVRQMSIHLVPVYEIEQQWLSIKALRAMWDMLVDWWPPAIDLADLELQRQPHKAISLVKILRDPSESYIFKSLTRNLKQMYHELKMLLTVLSHPNLISRPHYIVTKKCRFGRKVGVCGFLMEYYPLGTLREMLWREESGQAHILLRERFQWAKQLASTLQHINLTNLGFYPDLKPDNVLLCDDNGIINTTLIDLEQRGGWYSWSPPEVYYVEYIENLALSSDLDSGITSRYKNLLREYLPSWKPVSKLERYQDSTQGYSTAWLALSPIEQKAAQVFMLGKLLWCIFEGKGSINCGLGPDIFKERDSEFSFPRFQKTPVQLRACIEKCTLGAPEWRGRSRPFLVAGDRLKLYVSSDEAGTEGDTIESHRYKRKSYVLKAQSLVQAWWKQEIAEAEQFLRAKIAGKRRLADSMEAAEQVKELTLISQRPRIQSVICMLEEAEKAVQVKRCNSVR